MIPGKEEREDMEREDERMLAKTSGEPSSGETARGSDDCIEATALLHAHAEGELDPIRLRRVDEHLTRCGACREELRELHEERLRCMELLVKSPPLSPRFAQKVTGRIRARMRLDAARKRRGWIARGAAAAALIGITAFLAVRHPGDQGSPRIVLSPAELESADLASAEESSRVELASGPGRVEGSWIIEGPIHMPARPFPRPHSIVENMWGMISQANRSAWGVPKDPCAPDPNRDGSTDYRDVVHFVSVDMGVGSEVAFGGDSERDDGAAEDERAPVEPECDELCLRA